MQPMIVFDLRQGHIVAGIIDSLAGKLRWKAEMLQVLQREGGSPDPVTEADLCFFRPSPKEKRWIPILSDGLDQLPANYEKISDLFGQVDQEQMRTAIKTGLFPLLRPLMSDRKELGILFLVDTIKIADCMAEISDDISRKLKRPNRVIVAPDEVDLLAGYALLDMMQTFPAQESKIITCTVGEKLLNFQWNNDGFKLVPAKNPQPESKWDGIGDLERVGLVAFELVWSANLILPIQTRLEELTKENDILGSLLEKMDKVCGKLQGLSGRRPAQSV